MALGVVGLLLYYWVAWGDPQQRRAVRVFGLFSITGLLAVMGGALLDGNALYALWSLAIVLDLGGGRGASRSQPVSSRLRAAGVWQTCWYGPRRTPAVRDIW